MSLQVQANPSFIRLRYLLTEPIPEQLLASELSSYNQMLWKDAWYPDHTGGIMNKLWVNAKNKPPYQDIANQLDIGDQLAVFIMLTAYYHDMRAGEEIPQITATKFLIEIVANFFTYYLHEKLYKIKSIKLMLSLAFDRNHTLNPFILVYLNSDKVPDLLPFLWKKYTSLEALKYKPYLSHDEEAKCIILYYRQHIEWLTVIILYLHRFPEKALDNGLLKEILIFLLKNRFLHPTCIQLQNYPNSAFTIKTILYFSILLALKVTCILADKSALTESICKELFFLIPPNDVTAAPFILCFTMMLNGVLMIGTNNVWNLGAQSILEGALVALDDLLKFRLFQRCQHLRNIVGGIISKVLFKLLDNFEIEPIDQTETIYSLACNSFSSSDPIANTNCLPIAKDTILKYSLNSFPLLFKHTMEFLCAITPTLTASQTYSMLGSLEFFNTPLAGEIPLSEDRERCLTETTEILKSRSCVLYIPGRTFGEIVEWGGEAAIKWKFVLSAWNLFLGRLELFVDEASISCGDLEKAYLILQLVHCLLEQDQSLFDELKVFCSIAPAVFARAVELQFDGKGDILIYSIKLVNLLGEIDPDLFSIEMANANAFSNVVDLVDNVTNNPSGITRENSKLFEIILALLDLYEVTLTVTDIPTDKTENFAVSCKQLLQHILKNNLSINDNESILKIHKNVVSVLFKILIILKDSEKNEISSFPTKIFCIFLLKETSLIELMFFHFDMLERLTESQQSDHLRDSCVSLLASIINLLKTFLETFGKEYFALIENYIVRPDHSLIHVLSEVIMSLNSSQLMLASLGLLKELCRHSDFSLMVCLGRTAKSLKSSLTTKLRSSPVLLSSQVRIEILRFIQKVLQYQPSFAEYIFSQDDQNLVSIIIELLGNYGKDRKHGELIAACFSVLIVVWATRRDCIKAESLAKLWKSIKGILTLFYHKNIEYTETVLELSIGIVTIMMIEFYNVLFIPKIDSEFKEAMIAFLDDTYMENYFNLAFARQEKIPDESYYEKQIRFAVVIRQFISIFTSKSPKIEFIISHLNSKNRKNYIIECCFDQLQILCNNYSISEVEELFSELLLTILSLFKNWHESIKEFTEIYTVYVSSSTWLITQSNISCIPFQYYLTGSLLLLQSSRARPPLINVRNKDKDPLSQSNSLLFTNIVSVFSEILRNNVTVASILHELVILNISEIMHQDVHMNIFETAEATPLYFLVIECLKRSQTQNQLNLTNLYLLLLTTFSKYDIFAKSQDLSLYFQIVSDLLFCCSTDDPAKKQLYHEIWCSLLDLISTSLIYGKHNFLNEAKYYIDGVRFINEINSNLANCNSLLVLKENFHITMFLLHLSKMQNYHLNIPFDQLTLSLVQTIEVSIELLLHSEKLTQICINTENTLISDSKAKEVCEEISDVFSDRNALADRGKLWLYKTLRIALTSLHILTPSVEQIISYPSADYMVYCFIYNFQQPQHAYNRLIQPVSALCSCLTVSLELLNKIPAISPNQGRNQDISRSKSMTSSFTWVKNFIEITLSLILSQSCMVLLSGIPNTNKQLFKMHVSGEVENFLMALLRVLNRKNIQSTPNKRRSRLTCSLSMQSTGDSLSVKSSSLGFGDHPDQVFFMTVDNLRKQIF